MLFFLRFGVDECERACLGILAFFLTACGQIVWLFLLGSKTCIDVFINKNLAIHFPVCRGLARKSNGGSTISRSTPACQVHTRPPTAPAQQLSPAPVSNFFTMVKQQLLPERRTSPKLTGPVFLARGSTAPRRHGDLQREIQVNLAPTPPQHRVSNQTTNSPI
jgi:hypothetical protein